MELAYHIIVLFIGNVCLNLKMQRYAKSWQQYLFYKIKLSSIFVIFYSAYSILEYFKVF